MHVTAKNGVRNRVGAVTTILGAVTGLLGGTALPAERPGRGAGLLVCTTFGVDAVLRGWFWKPSGRTPALLSAQLTLTRDSLLHGHVWGVLTAGFLHADANHFWFALLAIAIAGRAAEGVLGTWGVVSLYTVSSAAGALTAVVAGAVTGADGHAPIMGSLPGLAGLAAATAVGAAQNDRLRMLHTAGMWAALFLVGSPGQLWSGPERAANLAGAAVAIGLAHGIGLRRGQAAAMADERGAATAPADLAWTQPRKIADSVLNDPTNCLVLRLSRLQILSQGIGGGTLAAGGAAMLALIVRTGHRHMEEALVSAGLVILGVVYPFLMRRGRVVMTPAGLRVWQMRSERFVAWDSIDRAAPLQLSLYQRGVALYVWRGPATAHARSHSRDTGVVILPALGMRADRQANLINEWRQRWATPIPASALPRAS